MAQPHGSREGGDCATVPAEPDRLGEGAGVGRHDRQQNLHLRDVAEAVYRRTTGSTGRPAGGCCEYWSLLMWPYCMVDWYERF